LEAASSGLSFVVNGIGLDLCAEAAICEDPRRLEKLAAQIAEILSKERQRLNARTFPASQSAQEQGAA